MSVEMRVTERGETVVLSKRLAVRLPEIGAVIGGSFGEAYAAIGSAAGGPPFVIYEEVPKGDEPFAIEICAPLARHVDAPAGWAIRALPAGRFATQLHVGPYDTIGAAYDSLLAAIASAGLAPAGAPREVYLSPPTVPPTEIRTIVEFPVAEVAVPA